MHLQLTSTFLVSMFMTQAGLHPSLSLSMSIHHVPVVSLQMAFSFSLSRQSLVLLETSLASSSVISSPVSMLLQISLLSAVSPVDCCVGPGVHPANKINVSIVSVSVFFMVF